MVESLAADHNLRIDRPGFEAERGRHADISRGTTEAADVFATGPLDTLKQRIPSRQRVRRLLDNRGRRAGHRHPRAEPAGRVGRGQRRNARWCSSSIERRSTASPAARSATPASIRGDRFPFQVVDTKKENDFILHVGHVAEGDSDGQRAGAAPRSTPTAARRSAAPTRRRTSCTTPCRRILGKHAQQAGSKVEPDRLRFDFANPEAVGRDRLRAIEEAVNLQRPRGRAGELVAHADRRRPGARRDGPLRREVSRHRPRGPDGRFLARALRRHASRQRGAGRAVQDHRRGVGRRRHAADHGAGRQGRARLRAPGRRDPGRAGRLAPRPAGQVGRASERPARGDQDAQETGQPAAAGSRLASHRRRLAGRRARRSPARPS